MDFKEYINNEEFENKKIEFKEIVSHKNYEKWAKTIAAFANTDGGDLFFGVDDDEQIVGFNKEQLKSEMLYINDICDKKLHPSVEYIFNKIKITEDLYVLDVKVLKNNNLPVWLVQSNEEEVIYIRRDGESVKAHGSQIETLILNSKRLPFDTTFTSFKYSDLSFNKLMELYQDRNNTQDIISLKVLKSIGAISLDDIVSNGLYLFSDHCDYKNCNVACRIWPGLSKGDSKMLDRKTFQGNIVDLLDFVRNYVALYTKQGLIKAEGEGRTNIISYPPRALEEALINAVAHRDYYIDGTQIDVDIFLDRIQIASPGNFLLPGEAQDYNMRAIPSKRRNEVICKILELCNLMESSGSGFDKIALDYEKYGEAYKPSVYSDPAQFIITLKDLSYKDQQIKEIVEPNTIKFKSPKSGNREFDKSILEFCLDSPKSRQEIQDYLNLSDRKNFIYSVLNPLIDAELLLPTQASLNSPNQKYKTNLDKISYN